MLIPTGHHGASDGHDHTAAATSSPTTSTAATVGSLLTVFHRTVWTSPHTSKNPTSGHRPAPALHPVRHSSRATIAHSRGLRGKRSSHARKG